MHILVTKKKITEHTQVLEKTTGKQLNLEVLKCILFEAKKDMLLLRATNLDLGIEVSIPCTVKDEGVVAVPASVFNGFLLNTTGEKVELKTIKNNLEIKTEKTKAVINTVPHDDFPTLPITKGKKIQVLATQLKKGFQSVYNTASLSTMKPELASVFMFGSGETITFVATDSFRLAEKVVQTKGLEEFPNILIPAKNAIEIVRSLEKTEEKKNIQLVVDEKNQASFIFDETHITTRLIDGTFPDYTQIIPKDHNTEVIVLKQDLLQALRITGVFANKFNQATITVDPKKKKFFIETTGSEVGEGSVSVDAAISGDEIEVSFNQKYITDGLQSIHGDSVSLWFSGREKPMVMKDTADSSFTYLTMPMNR